MAMYSLSISLKIILSHRMYLENNFILSNIYMFLANLIISSKNIFAGSEIPFFSSFEISPKRHRIPQQKAKELPAPYFCRNKGQESGRNLVLGRAH